MGLFVIQQGVHDALQVFLTAGAGKCGSAHGLGVSGKVFQGNFLGRDFGTDAGFVAAVAILDEGLDATVFDDFSCLEKSQSKGIHTQNKAIEHILCRVGGATVLGFED